MTETTPEFYFYTRAKSSGFGHSANKRNPIIAWENVVNFLEKHTIYEIGLPINIQLLDIDYDSDKIFIDKIDSFMGEPTRVAQNYYEWNTNISFGPNLNEFITGLIKEDIKPNRLRIYIHFSIKWKKYNKEASSKSTEIFNHFIGKGFHGYFGIIFDEKIFIQPEFVLINTSQDNTAHFLEEIKVDLPFNFSNKSFKSYYIKKLKNGKCSYKRTGSYE